MLLLNFSHPLSDAQLAQLADQLGRTPPPPIERPAQVDHGRSFADQAAELADGLGLSPRQWQTEPILINLPGLAPLAAALLAELHGRMGYFPTILRLRPAPGSAPLVYEVAEIINLQAIRDDARMRRTQE